ncbi:hypothetical protein F5883DRAFT_250943 [Diaporthe sp. PMI_573]|nr:hypothetical protein F5883DRAFT_250943 [Diaporthaceae sp. PMI_573]
MSRYFQIFSQCACAACQPVFFALSCLLCWFQSFSHMHRHVSMTMTGLKVAVVENRARVVNNWVRMLDLTQTANKSSHPNFSFTAVAHTGPRVMLQLYFFGLQEALFLAGQ